MASHLYREYSGELLNFKITPDYIVYFQAARLDKCYLAVKHCKPFENDQIKRSLLTSRDIPRDRCFSANFSMESIESGENDCQNWANRALTLR